MAFFKYNTNFVCSWTLQEWNRETCWSQTSQLWFLNRALRAALQSLEVEWMLCSNAILQSFLQVNHSDIHTINGQTEGDNAAILVAQNRCLSKGHILNNCKNKILNTVVEYTVVDYARSVVSGNEYFVIQDMEGQKKQVTKQELSEIIVCLD